MSTRMNLLALTVVAFLFLPGAAGALEKTEAPGGELLILGKEGKPAGACPLKHTDVKADVAGFIARVTVQQTFQNPLSEKIEAVYTFPLPQDSAVDSMVMTIGQRRIVGQIKEREEARKVYERAKAAGHVASLLDQERPNIFTQAVANLEPGATVVIEISYVETLKYEDGWFEFVFPMVVGPRYMPGSPTGQSGTGWASDTTQVPDASKISPPVTPPGTRAGHDISLTVNLNAGMPIQEIVSKVHAVDIKQTGPTTATVALKNQNELPNKDFVLRYRLCTDQIGDALLVYTDKSGGSYFTLILQPPQRVEAASAVGKEMIFVIDRSGSMSGFPIEKAKECMKLCIEAMGPNDSFDLHSFDGGTGTCFGEPVPNTPENRATALKYLKDLFGRGGTEMMPAVKQALGGKHDPNRVRVVCFMTDGYIGNDFAIIDEVQKSVADARVFSFGIGNSVNRFLLDGMAHAGRGEVEYVALAEKADAAAQRFADRIARPVLTDIKLDWGGVAVSDVYPAKLPDLFSAKPLIITGRLNGTAGGVLTLTGNTAAGKFERKIIFNPAQADTRQDALASLWARAKIKHLMNQDLRALQSGTFPEPLKKQIIDLGLAYRLMTQFTSFVAVEELRVTAGGESKTVAVPVEMPDGVSYEGVFGEQGEALRAQSAGFGGGKSRGPAPAACAKPFTKALSREQAGEGKDADPRADVPGTQPAKTKPLTPEESAKQKLDQALAGLAVKVAQEGTDGNLTVGKLIVKAWRVEMMVQVSDSSDKTLTALKQLGFTVNGEAKAVPVLVGTIDVRKLIDLAKLEVVLSVRPVL